MTSYYQKKIFGPNLPRLSSGGDQEEGPPLKKGSLLQKIMTVKLTI